MLVLFALMIPVILLFVGLALDLGWYYLNVSRLQNAADAAALAGSKKIVDKYDNTIMHGYYYAKLLTTAPSDLKEFTEVYYPGDATEIFSTDYTGNMQTHSGITYHRGTEHEQINMSVGEAAAKAYAVKNLGTAEDVTIENKTVNMILDSWNLSKKDADRKVSIQTKLYSTAIDYQEKRNGIRYYEVTLTEEIPHFFLSGLFKPMKAIVKSYALLKLHATDLVTTIDMFEPHKVIANWEYQNKYHTYTMKWNHYRQTIAGQKKVSYKTGDDFRTETVNVQMSGGSGIPTSANGNKYYSEDEVDSINIDFNQDVSFNKQFTSDWDLGSDAPDGTTIGYLNQDGWDENIGYDLRIQGLINLNYAYKNRNIKKIKSGNYTSADLLPDILWTRIESDPIWSKMPWGTQSTLDSVHQMIINVNEPNTEVKEVTDPNGNKFKVYTKRPYFIFYLGPEKNVMDYNDNTFVEDTTIRKSQPVILNLNADFNGILYMPNSPVIINGNGHTMRGFVIAKEYLKLKEDIDFTSKGYLSALDNYGHTIFFRQNDAISEEAFNNLREDYTITNDEKGGIFSLYEKIDEKQFLILRVTKENIDGTTHSIKNDFLSTTYKNDLKAFRNVTDEELSTVSFPDENNNNTLEKYPVVTADLSDTKVNDNYVKVLLHNGDNTTTEKYIDKTKLPYVKVRRDGNRPYVCVYDLKKQKDPNDKTVAGATIQDYNLAKGKTGNDPYSDADSRPKDNTYDYRSVNKALIEGTYYKDYVDDKVNLTETTGYAYFTFKPNNFLGQYRKITHDGVTEYIKEKDKKYYMKLVPNGSSEENPIIVDNYGNLQVKEKPLSDSSWNVTRPTNENEQPDDPDKYKILANDQTVVEQDYRDMKYEVVYKMQEAFNIAENYPVSGDTLPSGYSYFQIPELKRKNYKYFNVDELHKTPEDKWHVVDMFFTTKRASWLD